MGSGSGATAAIAPGAHIHETHAPEKAQQAMQHLPVIGGSRNSPPNEVTRVQYDAAMH